MAVCRRSLVLLALICLPVGTLADIDERAVEGIWLSADGTGWIKIVLGDSGPVGSIAGSAENSGKRSAADKDDLNPDPALRDRLLLGLKIMDGFTRAGNGKWKSGRIYDPNSGKTYQCKLTVVDENTLELRGYIGFSLLGRTETWTRSEVAE
ncbi:MAG: DUF2147 domain-containing protein [Gammaproteobacteria bacterium]|nr:DUF2147 domain-containing protein [Gammaproteobacteria bacterium]